MMLVEQTPVPAAALPVAQFRDHVRLGTGFADEGTEDALLETFLRAAMAAVEAWTGKVLIEREYEWTVTAWREDDAQALPVAPVQAILSLGVLDRADVPAPVDPVDYRLQPDTHRPLIRSTGGRLPAIPPGGRAVIGFRAGFGPAWSDVPGELGQAVMLLAAYYHEYRHEKRLGAAAMPYGVSVLVEPWRTMRLLGGGAR